MHNSNEYVVLLERAKKELENPENNSTGIEPCLKGQYMEQIIGLQKFINTTASTNCSDDPYFQEMFLCGFIHRSMVNDDLLDFLKKDKLSYKFYQ